MSLMKWAEKAADFALKNWSKREKTPEKEPKRKEGQEVKHPK